MRQWRCYCKSYAHDNAPWRSTTEASTSNACAWLECTMNGLFLCTASLLHVRVYDRLHLCKIRHKHVVALLLQNDM